MSTPAKLVFTQEPLPPTNAVIKVLIGPPTYGKTPYALAHFRHPAHIITTESWQNISSSTDGIVISNKAWAISFIAAYKETNTFPIRLNLSTNGANHNYIYIPQIPIILIFDLEDSSIDHKFESFCEIYNISQPLYANYDEVRKNAVADEIRRRKLQDWTMSKQTTNYATYIVLTKDSNINYVFQKPHPITNILLYCQCLNFEQCENKWIVVDIEDDMNVVYSLK